MFSSFRFWKLKAPVYNMEETVVVSSFQVNLIPIWALTTLSLLFFNKVSLLVHNYLEYMGNGNEFFRIWQCSKFVIVHIYVNVRMLWEEKKSWKEKVKRGKRKKHGSGHKIFVEYFLTNNAPLLSFISTYFCIHPQHFSVFISFSHRFENGNL